MTNLKNKGISIIEILIIIAIISAIVAVIIPNLSEFRNQQVLKNTREDVISLLNKARNNTISSKNSTFYGVHFEQDTATLFENTFIVDSPTNEKIIFDQAVNIPLSGGVNLSGGGNDIIFSRITGDTSSDGTIVLQIINDVTKQKIITVNKIGIISSN